VFEVFRRKYFGVLQVCVEIAVTTCYAADASTLLQCFDVL
jgi:hypothetical protein